MLIEIIQIVLIFILPVILMYFNIIPFKYRKHTLIVVSIITLIIVLLEKWSLQTLGLRLDNISPGIIPYTIFTIIGVIFLFTVSKILRRKKQTDFFKKKHFIYGFVLVSILQEFLFRGVLFVQLQRIVENPIIIILLNAILFTLIHSIYSNTSISLAIIFISGICFASIYFIYPNLILISISHAILNYVAVLYNFYYEEKTNIKIISYWEKTTGFVHKITPRLKRRK
jgi:membrane protease YdiL (CAAX protease family)